MRYEKLRYNQRHRCIKTMEKLKPKQKKFADTYLDTGNGTKSAFEVYDVTNENSAAAQSSRVLRNVKVQEYLESKAEKAASRVFELSLQDENKPVALGASKDILDRAGFKPVEKTESHTVNLNFDVKIDSKKTKIKEKFEKELYESL